MENKFSLQGKNALVVCPENGWGKDIVAGFLKAGAKVYLAGSDEKYMACLVKELGLAGYGVYDHETKQQTEEMVASAVQAMGSIDVLVENSSYTTECAGISPMRPSIGS